MSSKLKFRNDVLIYVGGNSLNLISRAHTTAAEWNNVQRMNSSIIQTSKHHKVISNGNISLESFILSYRVFDEKLRHLEGAETQPPNNSN